MSSLTDTEETVIVTGASSGIGHAVCGELLRQGFEVIAISRRPISAAQDRLAWIELDLAQPDRVDAAAATLARERRSLRALVCCAGTGRFGGLEEFSRIQIEALMNVNVISHIVLLKHCLPLLKAQGHSNVVLLGSESALSGGPQGSVYCASKFALRGLAQSLRLDCARSGVAVTLINPGSVRTPFFDSLKFHPDTGAQNAIEPGDVAELICQVLAMRPGTVVDEVNMSPLKKSLRFRLNN